MSDESEQLRQFVCDRSPEAFRALVDRYIGIVYAAARRQVGDADLAHDVTQAVFLVLTEKAAALDPDRLLSGWLLKVTRYASVNAVRSRARRNRHEQKAAQMKATTIADATKTDDEWQELAPLLDEGMSRLRAGDRDVLLLRYFEQKTAREMGLALGISEDAAEKRLARAVEKLRDFFRRRGVAVSAPGINAGLLIHASEATPKTLSAGISAAASSSASSIAKGVVITMATAKAKVAAIAAGVSLLLIGGGAVTWQTIKPASTRRVDVSAQVATDANVQLTAAAPPAIPAPGADKPTPWPVVFSDGTTVDVLALTDKPGTPTQWWMADGSPVAPPSPLPRNTLRITPQPNVHLYQFQIRETGKGLQDKSLSITPKIPAGGSAEGVDGTAERMMMNLVVAVADSPTVDLQLHLASGPWAAEERYDLWPTPAKRPSATRGPAHPSLEIGAITEKTGRQNRMTRIAVHQLIPHRWDQQQERIAVITTDGDEISPVGSSSNGRGVNDYDFPITRDKIAALVFRQRPYETYEIRNVSLKPGVKTVPTIVAVPTPASPASHPSN